MLSAERQSWMDPPRPYRTLQAAEDCPTWTSRQIGFTVGALLLGALWGYFTAQGG